LSAGASESGFLIVDKPQDITSAQVVARVKRLTRAKKVGHTGTLDPFATGVVICCLNQATKLSRFFLEGEKKYEATLCLGIATDTQDITGKVLSEADPSGCDEARIRSVFSQFEGEIEQHPPIYSALKHEGVPLYKLARKGKPVQKPARRVRISYIRVLDICLPEVGFEVLCSSGTYVRTLAADVGTALGCGGHLKSLRRTRSSQFTIQDALTLPELETIATSGRCSDQMIPLSDALPRMPSYIANDALKRKIKYGSPLSRKDLPLEAFAGSGEFVRVTDSQNNLLAVLSHRKMAHRYNYCCVFHQ